MKNFLIPIPAVLIVLFCFGCATTQPKPDFPSSQSFSRHSIQEIQSALVASYLSSGRGWSIKDQTDNSLTFTKVNDGMGGILMQAMVSGSAGSLPVLETQYSFATLSKTVTVYPVHRVINTNGFGRQDVTNVPNPRGAYEELAAIKAKLEPVSPN